MPKRFSPEFKQQAVSYALANSDQSIAALAKHLGIGESTLDRWVRQQHGGTSKRPLSTEQDRIRLLEKEVLELKQANEILKKAHVYFIKNPSR